MQCNVRTIGNWDALPLNFTPCVRVILLEQSHSSWLLMMGMEKKHSSDITVGLESFWLIAWLKGVLFVFTLVSSSRLILFLKREENLFHLVVLERSWARSSKTSKQCFGIISHNKTWWYWTVTFPAHLILMLKGLFWNALVFFLLAADAAQI